jgi:FAD/FMN-containing dehydrogenase
MTCDNCSSARRARGIIGAVVLRLFPKPRSVCTGLCAVGDYAAVLDLLHRARTGFGSQLTAFEVMWPQFYRTATVELGRKPPLDPNYGAFVLIETLGLEPETDQQRFEAVIGAAMQGGSVQDAVIAQSQRQAAELWSVRDSPNGRRPDSGRSGFDVSVPTGEIGALVTRSTRR